MLSSFEIFFRSQSYLKEALAFCERARVAFVVRERESVCVNRGGYGRRTASPPARPPARQHRSTHLKISVWKWNLESRSWQKTKRWVNFSIFFQLDSHNCHFIFHFLCLVFKTVSRKYSFFVFIFPIEIMYDLSTFLTIDSWLLVGASLHDINFSLTTTSCCNNKKFQLA